jgi:hypothetical protein
LLASSVKPGFAEVKKQEQEDMFVQAQIMLSFAKSHQKKYGRVRFILISYDLFDAFLVHSGYQEIVGVGCLRPYQINELAECIEKAILPGLLE